MQIIAPLLLFLLIPGAALAGRHISLQAEAGYFETTDLDRASTSKKITGSLRLTDYDHGTNWVPAAYIGFASKDGEQGRDNSFQFLLVKNGPSDDYLVAGYRIIEAGEQVHMESLTSIPDGQKVEVSLSILEGIIVLEVMGQEPMVINTSLKEVVAYISVSSGDAEFDIEISD
jgi:hypothetical protein